MCMRQAAALLCVGVVGTLSSCSSGPPAVKMGTPEWFWNATTEQFGKGELAKAQEHLEKIMATDNPYKRRAAPWHVVILAGLAEGHKQLAEAYDAGATAARAQGGEFRRVAQESQRAARMYSMGLAQEVEKLQKEMGDAAKYPLEFSFPRGNPSEITTLDRVRKGILPPEAERATAQRRTIERGVLLETAAVVGAGEDTAKAAALFKTLPVEVPREVFLYGVAGSLFTQAAIFDRRKLNEPDKKKLLLDMAARCLKPAAESSDEALKKKAKELLGKIEKEQKTLPKA